MITRNSRTSKGRTPRDSSAAPLVRFPIARARAGKGLVRALDRVGSRADRSPAVARKGPAARDETVCGGCGAVFARKTWRRSSRRLEEAVAAGSFPGVCPACRQVVSGEAFGRVLLEGTYVEDHAAELLRRIRNVSARAGYTQPERRLLGLTVRRATIEVLTTSQKLAHRIARELEKAFKGAASYRWSDGDGRLLAVWHRDG
jgi:hypothetical protein